MKWNSRLEFINLEINFFGYLIGKHLFTVTDIDLRKKAGDLKDGLMSLEFQGNNLCVSIKEQLTQLELMTDDVVSGNILELVVKQINLEHRMDEISVGYGELKKQIFALIKEILEGHKKPSFYCSPN